MNFDHIKQSFDTELVAIAEAKTAAAPGELRPHLSLSVGAAKMPSIKMPKVAATRAVKEWQKAQAGGDQMTSDQIAKGYGDLGLKPRQLKDVSTGGEEAGVDLMMGRKAVPSTGEVNQSGYVARKLYKPDSAISRGDFTHQLLGQKQQATDAARAMSPEAKQMVPAMYGHETAGQGGLQRNISYHEYVPGISDLRGQKAEVNGRDVFSRPREKYMGDVENVENKVLKPMQEKGMTLGDTVRARTGGGRGVNWGNVVNSPQGPKVLDFLPSMQGQKNPAFESYKAHFGDNPTSAPAYGGSRFSGDAANVGSLRKEVFKPTMDVTPPPAAGAGQPPIARSGTRASMPPASHAPEAMMATSLQGRGAPAAGADSAQTSVPAARGGAGGVQPMRTAPTAVPAARASGALAHAPTMPSAAHSMGTAAPFNLVKKAPLGGALQAAEHSVAAKAPGMLTRIGKFLR